MSSQKQLTGVLLLDLHGAQRVLECLETHPIDNSFICLFTTSTSLLPGSLDRGRCTTLTDTTAEAFLQGERVDDDTSGHQTM